MKVWGVFTLTYCLYLHICMCICGILSWVYTYMRIQNRKIPWPSHCPTSNWPKRSAPTLGGYPSPGIPLDVAQVLFGIFNSLIQLCLTARFWGLDQAGDGGPEGFWLLSLRYHKISMTMFQSFYIYIYYNYTCIAFRCCYLVDFHQQDDPKVLWISKQCCFKCWVCRFFLCILLLQLSLHKSIIPRIRSELVDVKKKRLQRFSQNIWLKSSPVNTAFSCISFPFIQFFEIDPPWVLHPPVQPVRGLAAVGPTSKMFRWNGITTFAHHPRLGMDMDGSSLYITSICCTYDLGTTRQIVSSHGIPFGIKGSLKFDPGGSLSLSLSVSLSLSLSLSTQLADLRKPGQLRRIQQSSGHRYFS